jgi:hypothetical protein
VTKKLLFSLMLLLISLSSLHAKENQTTAIADSASCFSPYRLWLDVGVYPIWFSSEEGAFYPTINARAGLGKSFSTLELYGFAEMTMHKFDGHDGFQYQTSSNQRYDIALYGMGAIAEIIYIGAGIYYTHQDNIVTHQSYYPDTTYQSGVRSFYRFYYVVGAGYHISISHAISLPIGLYYRNQDYSDRYIGIQKISVRLGARYAF